MMGSWFSHINRPLNGLGFMKGIAELHIRKNSYWIGFYLLSYPGTWFLHIEFSQVNCVSIFYSSLFSIMHGVPHSQVSST